MNDESGPPASPKLRGLVWFMVAWAVLLLLAGANVTSTRSGDAVPDWPWSYGAVLWPDRWTEMRNVFYEHGHRLIAQVMGLLTLAAAIWIQRAEPRRWVRRLAWTAFAAVVFQGVLGGVRVLAVSRPELAVDPTLMKVLHAVTSEFYFCLVVALACVLSPSWRDAEQRPLDAPALSVERNAFLGVALVVVQLVLGALARHGVLPREVHAVFALPVALVLFKLVLTAVAELPASWWPCGARRSCWACCSRRR